MTTPTDLTPEQKHFRVLGMEYFANLTDVEQKIHLFDSHPADQEFYLWLGQNYATHKAQPKASPKPQATHEDGDEETPSTIYINIANDPAIYVFPSAKKARKFLRGKGLSVTNAEKVPHPDGSIIWRL